MLGSANLVSSVFLVFSYYNFVKRDPFATKFCTHSVTDNMNKCRKFGDCMISIFRVCIYRGQNVRRYVWLSHKYAHTRK